MPNRSATAPKRASCWPALMSGAPSWLRSWASGLSGSQWPHVPEGAGLEEVGAVDGEPVLAGVAGDARQRVVELVDELHLAHAEVVHLVELAVDVVDVAGRHVAAGQPLVGAAERHARLDAHHHGELAGVDHAARLPRAADDPVEALARAAVLGVDVVLEVVHVLGLEAHGVHVVAGVVLDRVDHAELVVLDQEVDEDPQAAAPRALQPLPVRALVGQRVGLRPVDEGRPADRVVRRLAGEHRLQRRAVPLGERVVGAVDERVRAP